MKFPAPETTPYPEDALGRFWLAGHEEGTALPGRIRVDASQVTIEMEGALAGSHGLRDVVIFGRLSKSSEFVTVYNAFTESVDRSFRGAISSRISSSIAVFGAHAEVLTATSIGFRLPYCAQWFHEDTFEASWPAKDGKTIIAFDAYAEHDYALLDGYTLKRCYIATVPCGNWGAEKLVIERPMSFRVTVPTGEAVPFDVLWEKMRLVQRFFEFLSRSHMPPTHLTAHVGDDAPERRPDARVYVYYSGTAKRAEIDDHLVRYDDVAKKVPAMLLAWERLCRDAPDVVARYVDAFDRDGADTVLHFLWNAVAVEEMHKVRTGDREKPTFKGRLSETASRWTPVTCVETPDVIIGQIKDTRHYYAHGAGDLRGKASKDWELLRHGYYLEALASLEILHRLEMSVDEVISVGKSRYWLKENLSLQRFPIGGAASP